MRVEFGLRQRPDLGGIERGAILVEVPEPAPGHIGVVGMVKLTVGHRAGHLAARQVPSLATALKPTSSSYSSWLVISATPAPETEPIVVPQSIRSPAGYSRGPAIVGRIDIGGQPLLGSMGWSGPTKCIFPQRLV